MSSSALNLLAQPGLKVLPEAPPSGPKYRLLGWLQERTGVQPRHLALGLQMVAAYTTGGWG